MADFKAVIFDIGGVVMGSPFTAIAKYERDQGLPFNYLNCSIVGKGENGAWQKFERGEMPLLQFYKEFSRDLSDTVNGNLWYQSYCERRGIECPRLPEKLMVNGRDLFGAMMREASAFDPHVRQAIQRIRAAGRHKVIALTNNFSRVDVPPSELTFLGWDQGAIPPSLRELFDDFCDSSMVGLRKPDPAFYILACSRNNVQPREAVFLDDIGINLKPAKELGMRTIHVRIGRTLQAVQELETLIKLDLTGDPEITGNSKL